MVRKPAGPKVEIAAPYSDPDFDLPQKRIAA
jgi:hypothetical protein